MRRDGPKRGGAPTQLSVDLDGRKKATVNVNIGGTRLSIKSDRDPRYVAELAEYIDSKLDALQKAAPSVTREKLMMLISLNVAEELFDAQGELRSLKDSIQVAVGNCLNILDSAEDDSKS